MDKEAVPRGGGGARWEEQNPTKTMTDNKKPKLNPDNRPGALASPRAFSSPRPLLSSSWMQINLRFTVRIFESGISNGRSDLFRSAPRSRRSENVCEVRGDVSLVIVNLSPLSLRRLLCGEAPSMRRARAALYHFL